MKSRGLRSALLGVLIVLGMYVPLVTSQGRTVKAIIEEPFTVSRVALMSNGQVIAEFAELVGITSGYEIDTLELTSKKMRVPNSRMPPAVVLRRAKTSDMTVWKWHVTALSNPNLGRVELELWIYDTKGDPVSRYHLTDAWPAKVEIGALKAGASEVLMETVTMTCEQIQRVAV